MKKKLYKKPASNVIRLNIKDQLLDNKMGNHSLPHTGEGYEGEDQGAKQYTVCLMKRMAGILSQNQTVFGTIKFEMNKLKKNQ